MFVLSFNTSSDSNEFSNHSEVFFIFMSMLFLLRENVWATVFEFLQPLFLVQTRGIYLPQEKY